MRKKRLQTYKFSLRSLDELAHLIMQGKVVAAPTETAYGLLADGTNAKMVREVVRIKGREPGKPIALMAADLAMVKKFFSLSKHETRLAQTFWPGALTLLLRPKRIMPKEVSLNGLIGVRVPGSIWLRELIVRVNKPLTATSANRAGGATPYSVMAVRKQLSGRGLQYVVDKGRLKKRPTSTVIRVHRGKLVILRAGAVSETKLKSVLDSKKS